jgi:hypothetical protein
MDFVNKSSVPAGWTMGFAPDGRELIVIAIKATFVIPHDQGTPEHAAEQAPLVQADEFTGEAGLSAPLYETDYAHRKPMCDVVLNGSAYAPPGKTAKQIVVGMRVGAVSKTFTVVGNRVWRDGVLGLGPSGPEPFEVMPISYDNAFGGTDRNGNPIKTFLPNPIGRGYAHYTKRIDGQPLPNTEEAGASVTSPAGDYRPMSFGPIGRNWPARVKYTGTYDEKWLQDRRPFWPDDFDYRYFQSAPLEQQMPYPSGGEPVVLTNLTPEADVRFNLPTRSIPLWVVPHRGKTERVEPVIDTIVIEPDLGRFTMTWRAVVPMQRSCFDTKQVIVGDMPAAWQRAQKYGGKPYYQGLAELVRARRRRG